jgi:hypothetical protein
MLHNHRSLFVYKKSTKITSQAAQQSQSRFPTKMTPKAAQQLQSRFPRKLHQLLESTDKNGLGHIISWLPDGESFKVHDIKNFTNEVLPVFFGTIKFKSFQRNLNWWGFNTVSNKGPEKGTRSHPKAWSARQ